MMDTIDNNTNRSKQILSLRKTIYILEAMNLHKKIPQNDTEMVDKIIREINRFVENEEVK